MATSIRGATFFFRLSGLQCLFFLLSLAGASRLVVMFILPLARARAVLPSLAPRPTVHLALAAS